MHRCASTSSTIGAEPRGKACALAVAWAGAHHEGMDELDAAWHRIEVHACKEFRTKTGLPFTYKVIGASVQPGRTRGRDGKFR
jgi:hypothetical protein